MATKQEIIDYVSKLQAYIDSCWKAHGYTFASPPMVTIDWGRKNAKIVKVDDAGRGSRSVHSFVEIETGNILKAAGWNSPAKGVRGNIATVVFGENVGEYGAAYLR